MLIHYHRQYLKGRLDLPSRSLHALGWKSIKGLLTYQTVITVRREEGNPRLGYEKHQLDIF